MYSGLPFLQYVLCSPGRHDWVAWRESELSRATSRLPDGYYVLGDAAYPLSEKLLTPYPGKRLPRDLDSFNFHLSQLRIKIEQSFGILVSTWGILWKPLRLQFAGRGNLIECLFHLHNFLRDEKVEPIRPEEESEESREDRPELEEGCLPGSLRIVQQDAARLTSSGETLTRRALVDRLEQRRQYRPSYNLARNAGRS